MSLTYNKKNRLIEFRHNGVSRWYTLWTLAELGFVSDELIARAILNPESEVFA